MGNYTILKMFENPRRGKQARNFTTNVPKILDLKSSSAQIFSENQALGAHEIPIPFCRLHKPQPNTEQLAPCITFIFLAK